MSIPNRAVRDFGDHLKNLLFIRHFIHSLEIIFGTEDQFESRPLGFVLLEELQGSGSLVGKTFVTGLANKMEERVFGIGVNVVIGVLVINRRRTHFGNNTYDTEGLAAHMLRAAGALVHREKDAGGIRGSDAREERSRHFETIDKGNL